MKKTVLETHNSNYYDLTSINCACQVPIYTEINNYAAPDTNAVQAVETFLQSPQNREEVKQIKRKNTILKKARTAFNRFLRERKTPFKEATQPHIHALTVVKDAEESVVKNSTEWKDLVKYERGLTRSYEKFKEKHMLYHSTMKELFGFGHALRYRYYYRPQRLLQRFLRTKV